MPTLLLYLLKANVALVLFYLAYYLVLRKLTFYHLNRLFLVFGILFSAIYPLVDLSKLFSRHEELAVVQSYAIVIPEWTPTAVPEQAPAFDYWLIPVGLFWLGCGLMLLRLIVQFVSLYRIHRTSVPASYQGVAFRKVPGISEAFSFWKTIYLNPAQHKSPELESILRHEQIHVNGWHTLDVLLAEVSTLFYWFNPGVWLMKQAMKENLEFIADQHVVNAGVDRVAYQYLLLKVVGATQPQLANQFNFPSLKRRIAMMNKMPTNKASRLRLLVVLPIVAALIVGFSGTAQTLEQDQLHDINPEKATVNILAPATGFSSKGEQPDNGLQVESQKETYQKLDPVSQTPAQDLPQAELYYIDGLKVSKDAVGKMDPNTIHSINVIKGEKAVELFGKNAAKGVIVITTEQNKDSRQVQEFNKKLPVPPAPPAPPAPGTPPAPPAPAQETVPPVPPAPPAPVGEQLPPPPPPTRYEGPAIPKAGESRVVETEEHVAYFLWPEEITKRELEVAKQAFKDNDFELNLNEKYAGGKVSSLKIELASKNKKSRASATYNAEALKSILDADNIVIVQGNKKTGEVRIATTLAPR